MLKGLNQRIYPLRAALRSRPEMKVNEIFVVLDKAGRASRTSLPVRHRIAGMVGRPARLSAHVPALGESRPVLSSFPSL